MAVTLHYIRSPTEWPFFIRDFAQSICRPLPPSLVPHIGSVTSFEKFAMAVATSQTEQELLSLLNIITWTVRDLQHLSGYEALDNNPHSTLFPMYNLLKALAHVLEPTLEVA